MPTVFIDGQAGTTGLEISQRLSDREGIDLLTIEDALRKDPAARLALMGGAVSAVGAAGRSGSPVSSTGSSAALGGGATERARRGWASASLDSTTPSSSGG